MRTFENFLLETLSEIEDDDVQQPKKTSFIPTLCLRLQLTMTQMSYHQIFIILICPRNQDVQINISELKTSSSSWTVVLTVTLTIIVTDFFLGNLL